MESERLEGFVLTKVLENKNGWGETKSFIKKEEISLPIIRSSLKEMYNNLPEDFIIQYKDEEDIISVQSPRDLEEALKFLQSKQLQTNYVHFFLVSKKEGKISLHAITQLFLQMSLKEHISKSCILFVIGSHFKGTCVYPAENTDSFPFSLTVCKTNEKENELEGIMEWPTLNKTITKWVGIVSKKENLFKWREYEAIKGQDEIELPNNYKANLIENNLIGKIVTKAVNSPTFTLDFCGIRSPSEGWYQLYSTLVPTKNPSRIYDLSYKTNSLERPTLEEQQMVFKNLTKGSDLFYIPKSGILQPRSDQDIEKEGYRHSCVRCGSPLFAKSIDIDPSKIELVCDYYPFCELEKDFFFWY